MVESSALLKRRTPKGYRGFESLPHRAAHYEALTTPVSETKNESVVCYEVNIVAEVPGK